MTVAVTLGAGLFASLLALVSGLARVYGSPWLAWIFRTYTEVFRGLSALVLLYWLYFALPLLGISLDALSVGIIGLGLHFGAYGTEIVRGALSSINKSQIEASNALGFSAFTRIKTILIPQALPLIIQPAGMLWIELLKNSALVSLITLNDLTRVGKVLMDETLKTTLIFSVLLGLYYLMSQILSFGFNRWSKRAAHWQRSAFH